MQTLSQKKKIGILAGAILLLTVVALVSTGRMSLTGLKSDALSSSDYACSVSGQQKKLAQYTNAPANKIKAENNIGIINNEIVVLNGKISAKEVTIGEKQAQIATRPAEIVRINGLIEPLRTYIETNCQNKNTSICKNKIKQKLKLENEIVKLNNLETDITKLQNEIGTSAQSNTLKGKIQLKQNNIATWQRKIDGYNLLITNYESCEAELGVKFYPACSFIFHTLGMDLNTPCENESGKIFQGYPFGQAGVEYRFMLKGSEVKDVSVQSLTFFLGGTDEQKIKFTNIRLSTGIETNDVIAQCEKTGDSIHCPLSSPITLKKQDIVYWYLNANIDIAEDHGFTLDAGGINVGGQYDTKNKNQNTKFAFIAYAKSPITGEPGNFNVWETKKDQTIKLGSGSQTLYEFQVKAENGEVAMTDVVLSSEFLEGSGQLPEQFISCADPRLRNQLFDGMLELYDGTKLIATSEDYSQTYTKFDIKNPILIKPNTEKKFTIKANMQSSGVGAQCSFSVTPNILANSGSFSTHESNYITTIKATDASFRYASWTCYNGEKQNEGGTSSCKPQTLWKQYAETFCQNKCSPETGKCGVNNYSNSEQCDDAPSGCGNGIKEGAEQCDDGNTINGDGCDSLCKSETNSSCVDSDSGKDYFTKGFTTYTAPGVLDTDNDTCINDTTLAEQYCDGNKENFQSITTCPNGCNDGACKTTTPVESCEDLAVSPNITQGGGTVTYTCQSNTDILCVLDPKYCTPKTYSVVIKKPDGEIVQTFTTATGSITIPSNPTGTYTAECFVNGQTTTPAACKKTITNQEPVIACTGTLPTNATILANVGNISRPWTYDGSPTGPYQNCSFQCPTGTTFKNNACLNLITAEYVESGPRNRTVYVIPAGSDSLGDDTSHNFYIKSAEDITIRELTLQVDHPESIRYIWVGGPANKAAVIDGKAVISGLNQYVRGNHPTNLIQIYLQYNSVGVGGIPSNTSSKITITDVKYDNSKSERIGQGIESSSIPMYIVGSMPSIYPFSDYSFTGLQSGVNKIGEFIIASHFGNSRDIKVNEILVQLSAGDFPEGTNIENIQLKKSTGASFSCTKTGGMIKCPFGTESKTDFDGYIIPGGNQEIFSIYGTINGPLSDNSYVSTKIDMDNFSWDDGSTNGASGLNLSGKYLPNTTVGTYTIRK